MTLAILLLIASGLTLLVGLRLRRPAPVGAPDPLPPLLRAAVAVPIPGALAGLAPCATAEERERAGLTGAATAERLRRAGAGLTAIALSVAGLLALSGPAGVVLGLAVAGMAAIGPRLWVRRRGAARARRIARDLPDVLDLLGVCVAAGMPLDAALATAADRSDGPLGEELTRTLAQMALGTPRARAYAGLARRAGAPELEATVTALRQADELGTPLGAALAGQAEGLREARRQSAREAAAKAAPKIQLVVALMMVPAVLLVVIAVFVSELVREVTRVVGA